MGSIVTTEFTPWPSLFGGTLIGISAVMVMGLLGKIAGTTGITRGAMPGADGAEDRGWRISFLLGLIAAPLVVLLATGSFPQQIVSDNLIGMVIAGLLVGVGTTLGSGCTSGHGVCGLARLSPRSLASVCVFLATAVLTITLIRHVF